MKLPEVAQIGHGKTLAEFLRQSLCEQLQGFRTIGGTAASSLLALHDELPHLPVRLNHGLVDVALCRLARLQQDVTYLCPQIILGLWMDRRRQGPIGHHALYSTAPPSITSVVPVTQRLASASR